MSRETRLINFHTYIVCLIECCRSSIFIGSINLDKIKHRVKLCHSTEGTSYFSATYITFTI